MAPKTRLEKKVRTIKGINPKFLKKFSEKAFEIEDLSKEKIVPGTHSFDHLKKKKGGSVKKKKKFPDLSGDGKITKKDILMAKGVIKKTKKRKK
jgi:hypothetical protein|tara:strand:+ start:212 stop:493 length:282 start_codon:yes stop_codon:yes gene_type:complete